MLQHASGLKTARRFEGLRHHVNARLQRIFQEDGASSGEWLNPGIGLAVSGGVDSMALATLCAEYKSSLGIARRHRHQFSGFIVDHGVREGSKDEASRVADELDRIGIEPRILTLDWSNHGDPKAMKDFENLARQLRYQAIGKACYESRIKSLLVAHHRDDQVETALIRILNRYYGQGLVGMRASNKISNCHGIYGVNQSGSPYLASLHTGWLEKQRNADTQESEETRVAIESGGVQLHRLMLAYPKKALYQVCKDANVKWFEDHTNANRTLTARNTFRHLQKSGDLPAAFGTQNMIGVIGRIFRRRMKYEAKAADLFNELAINLDVAAGALTLDLDKNFTTGLGVDTTLDLNVKAFIMRRIFELVTPHSSISLQSLHLAIDYIFGAEQSHRQDKIQTNGCFITRKIEPNSQTRKFLIHREKPYRQNLTLPEFTWPKKQQIQIIDGVAWSDWLLWDSRYWIRLGHKRHPPDKNGTRYAVTFFSDDQLGRMRKQIEDSARRRGLDNCLEATPGTIRWTIPAIIAIPPGSSFSEETDVAGTNKEDHTEIFALPSIRWNNYKRGHSMVTLESEARKVKQFWTDYNPWRWEIRYKEVDFGKGEKHKFVFGQEAPEKNRARPRREETKPPEQEQDAEPKEEDVPEKHWVEQME